ncbi:hypothetical protein BB560_002969 [Smittium megazygosporum]|uniref:WH2 domain-containing protein n=1 Tax=Smittium megazygosporum TaxID=133381 RepID=A0A2T9ZD96_9FUNG|nr:hypothetical protein BB560_002969 [Smittium megazygosporum]
MDRSALLQQIQKGAKLKKTVTNDRSAPQTAGRVVDPNNPGASPAVPSVPKTQNSAPEAPQMPMGIGNIFANGIPKLKKMQGGVNTGKVEPLNSFPGTPPPSLPPLHKEPITNSNAAPFQQKSNLPSFSAPKPSFNPITPGPSNSIDRFESKPNSSLPPKPPLSSSTGIKKKPPPPPPSKKKPSVFLPTHSPSNSFGRSSQFSKFSSNSISNAGTKPINKAFEDISLSDAARRGSAPLLGGHHGNNKPLLNSNLNDTTSNSLNSSFSTNNQKWAFHPIDMLPKILANDIPSNPSHLYPSGRAQGSTEPFSF